MLGRSRHERASMTCVDYRNRLRGRTTERSAVCARGVCASLLIRAHRQTSTSHPARVVVCGLRVFRGPWMVP